MRKNIVWLLFWVMAFLYAGQQLGQMPYQLSEVAATPDGPIQNWVLHQFFHRDHLSFAVNVVFLLLVGTSSFAVLGNFPFLVLFIASGLTTVITTWYFFDGSRELLGATGSMAGVIGFWFYRHATQSCGYLWLTPVLPFKEYNRIIHLPSFISIFVWLLPEGLNHYFRPESTNNWPIYGGGFLFGALFALAYSQVESIKID